jgi:hypothetical protein
VRSLTIFFKRAGYKKRAKIEEKQNKQLGLLKFLQDELSKSLYKHLHCRLYKFYISKEVNFTPTSLNEYKSALHIGM